MLEQRQALVLALGIVALLSTAATVQVKASSTFEGIGRDIDSSISDYQRGDNDGEEAGEDDYPNRGSGCPSGENMAYCAGWVIGWNRGFDAARTTSD